MAFNATDEKERKVVNVGGGGTFLTLRVSSERRKRRLFLNYVALFRVNVIKEDSAYL